MSSKFNLLYHGSLSEVIGIVNSEDLTKEDLQLVLSNVIQSLMQTRRSVEILEQRIRLREGRKGDGFDGKQA